jgi:hypothetical protein
MYTPSNYKSFEPMPDGNSNSSRNGFPVFALRLRKRCTALAKKFFFFYLEELGSLACSYSELIMKLLIL